jgi:hypothetical protein
MMFMNAHALVEILYYVTIKFATTCDIICDYVFHHFKIYFIIITTNKHFFYFITIITTMMQILNCKSFRID